MTHVGLFPRPHTANPVFLALPHRAHTYATIVELRVNPMQEREESDQSWAWLLLLLGISALLMTVWFLVYPVAALLCTLTGIFICLVALALSGARSGAADFQADRRET
jgi:hypothetical protein